MNGTPLRVSAALLTFLFTRVRAVCVRAFTRAAPYAAQHGVFHSNMRCILHFLNGICIHIRGWFCLLVLLLS
jgi:hypothetical protein